MSKIIQLNFTKKYKLCHISTNVVEEKHISSLSDAFLAHPFDLCQWNKNAFRPICSYEYQLNLERLMRDVQHQTGSSVARTFLGVISRWNARVAQLKCPSNRNVHSYLSVAANNGAKQVNEEITPMTSVVGNGSIVTYPEDNTSSGNSVRQLLYLICYEKVHHCKSSFYVSRNKSFDSVI